MYYGKPHANYSAQDNHRGDSIHRTREVGVGRPQRSGQRHPGGRDRRGAGWTGRGRRLSDARYRGGGDPLARSAGGGRESVSHRAHFEAHVCGWRLASCARIEHGDRGHRGGLLGHRGQGVQSAAGEPVRRSGTRPRGVYVVPGAQARRATGGGRARGGETRLPDALLESGRRPARGRRRVGCRDPRGGGAGRADPRGRQRSLVVGRGDPDYSRAGAI